MQHLSQFSSVLGKEHSLRDCLFLFLFSFHGRGISFVDMCHLKKRAVKGDEIHYYRRKTGGKLVVKITGPMRCIMAHFAAQTQGSPYLFPPRRSRRPGAEALRERPCPAKPAAERGRTTGRHLQAAIHAHRKILYFDFLAENKQVTNLFFLTGNE